LTGQHGATSSCATETQPDPDDAERRADEAKPRFVVVDLLDLGAADA